MSKQVEDVSFLTMASNSAHKGTHKIQLLTYSCNVERVVEVKLSLKSKRESEKSRELDKRHLMHVIILLNIINIQANRSVQTVVNREAGKPWLNSVLLLFQSTLSWTITNKCGYQQGKKRKNLPKSYVLALLYGKAKWSLLSAATTPCWWRHASSRSLFHLRLVLLVVSAR